VKKHGVPQSLFLPLTLLVSSFLMGCGASTVKVDGDVFIVTRSGESVKLALVEVRAVPGAEMGKFLETKIHIIPPGRQEREATLKQARANFDEADRQLDRLLRTDTPMSKELAAFKEKDSRKKTLDKAKADLEYWVSAAIYFEDLPPGTVSVKTDPDGRFTLTLPRKEKVVLAAQAQRQILDHTEYYSWMVPLAPEKNRTKRVFLSNDNLFNPAQAEQLLTLIKQKPASGS
jgi:hypothetical protein